MAKTTVITGSYGSKARSALKGGDPRPGIGGTTKGETLNGFSANPFRDGGAQEIHHDNAAHTGGVSGPRLGKAPKVEEMEDASSAKMRGRIRGGD